MNGLSVDGSFRATLMRRRVNDALAASTAQVRALVAPRGSGKTTALRDFVAGRRDAAYIRVIPGATNAWLQRALHSHDAATEIALDDADLASPPALQALLHDLETIRGNQPRYVLAGCSRSRLWLQRLLSAGIAEYFDQRFLAFDRREIVAFVEMLRIGAEPSDVDQLLYDTDGWAVAVSWILRDTARAGRTLRGAFDIWREHNDYLLLEYVTEASTDEAASRTFRGILKGSYLGDVQDALVQLEALGFPVTRGRSGLRPYHILTQLAAPPPRVVKRDASGILALSLFGKFACSINGRPVTFPRRREQNVLAFIALAPGASVTRAELTRTFWPDAPSAVASQGLRTTLSRLRKTIAAAGGDPARFIRVEPVLISLNMDRVTIDARRFEEHVERGRSCDARGDVAGCREHFRIAERIYASALLSAEAVEPALASRVAYYTSLFESVLRRLVEIYLAEEDAAGAHSYVQRLARLDQSANQLANAGDVS